MTDLAHQVCEWMQASSDAAPSTLIIIDKLFEDSDPAVASFKLALHEVLPQTTIKGSQASSDAKDSITVTLSVAERSSSRTRWSHREIAGGRFAAIVGRGPTTKVLTVGFSDKPWAEDWAAFVNNAQADTRWISASSSSPGVTEQEAVVSAPAGRR